MTNTYAIIKTSVGQPAGGCMYHTKHPTFVHFHGLPLRASSEGEAAPEESEEGLQESEKIASVGIPIMGEIGWGDVHAVLNMIRSLPEPVPLAVDICSPGGSFECGLALYDIFATWRNHVTTVVYGCASSAAALVMQAGDLRVISPYATIMIHDIQQGYEGILNDAEADKAKRRYQTSQRRLIDTLARRSGQTQKQIRAWCKRDTIFSAEEAVKYGFADEIIPFREPPKK